MQKGTSTVKIFIKHYRRKMNKILTFIISIGIAITSYASFWPWANNDNNTDESVIKIASMPTFGALQPITYEIIKQLPEVAKKHGLKVRGEAVKVKNSIDGNAFLVNEQIDVNVGAISSFLTLHSKAPDSARILSGLGQYRFMLMCQNDIKTYDDVLKTKIAVSSPKTMENKVLRWLAVNELKNASAFEKSVIVLPRPQIYQMFKANSKDIRCVITGTPLQNQLLNDFNLNIIGYSDPKNNGFTGSYSHYWTSTKWANNNPKLALIFAETAVKAINEYNQNPKPILDYFIVNDKMETTAEKMLQYEEQNVAQWHTDMRDAEQIKDFLWDSKYLKNNRPQSVAEFILHPEITEKK